MGAIFGAEKESSLAVLSSARSALSPRSSDAPYDTPFNLFFLSSTAIVSACAA